MAGLTTRCNGRVQDPLMFQGRRCQRAATGHSADGKGWCTQHHPDKRKAKQEQKLAKMRETLRIQEEVSTRAKDLAAKLGASYHSGVTQQELVIPFTEVEKLIAKIDRMYNEIFDPKS